jgi:hypothetical protein
VIYLNHRKGKEIKDMMTIEEMLTKVIEVKGFEHRDTIWFAGWLERNADKPYQIKVDAMKAALDDTEWDWEED